MLRLVTHARAVAVVGFLPPFVCVCFSARYLKNRCSRISKLDIEMSHDESMKVVYSGVRRSKVKVTGRKNITGVGLCTLVSAGFLWFSLIIERC